MKLQAFVTLCLVGSLYSAPTDVSHNATAAIITDSNFREEYVIYTAEYDIVNFMFPLNALNNDFVELPTQPVLLFVLADNKNGQNIHKGIFIRKNGEVTKLLDNGVDASFEHKKGSKDVYIAATDGIYYYDADKNKAEKYGIVTDNIINIAKCVDKDLIYILTDKHKVYSVTEKGMKKNKVTEIDNAQQIVLDFENNLYYVSNNDVYVLNAGGVTKKIEGLPENRTDVKLMKPPVLVTNGVPVIIDNKVFYVSVNETTSYVSMNVVTSATAYSVEGTFLFYGGYKKKIYEFNIVNMILDSLIKRWGIKKIAP